MLTLQYIPYVDIEPLTSGERIEKLLRIVKEDKIILLEGKLRPEEEKDLIKKTMESISPRFTGIEISPINVDRKSDQALLRKARSTLINLLLGDRRGVTIIGPASIVKEIKHDPDKIQLLTEEGRKRKKRR